MTALLILVLVSFLLMLVLKASSVGVKHVADTYIKTQAELFMQSSIENAILAIEGYERNNSSQCLKHIYFTSSDGRFESNTTILRYYCYDLDKCPNCDIAVPIQTSKSQANVVLYTIVKTTNSPRNGGKKIKIAKLTLQKP
jgi:hypothetical protein